MHDAVLDSETRMFGVCAGEWSRRVCSGCNGRWLQLAVPPLLWCGARAAPAGSPGILVSHIAAADGLTNMRQLDEELAAQFHAPVGVLAARPGHTADGPDTATVQMELCHCECLAPCKLLCAFCCVVVVLLRIAIHNYSPCHDGGPAMMFMLTWRATRHMLGHSRISISGGYLQWNTFHTLRLARQNQAGQNVLQP